MLSGIYSSGPFIVEFHITKSKREPAFLQTFYSNIDGRPLHVLQVKRYQNTFPIVVSRTVP